MRIQLLSINFSPEHTGVAPYSTGLARHLSLEHDVTVITGLPHYPSWVVPPEYRHWRREESHDKLRIIRLSHFVPASPNVVGRAAYEFTWAMRAAAAGARLPTDMVVAVVPALMGAHAARLIARKQHVPLGIFVQDIMGTAAAQSGVRGGRLVARATSRLERSVLRGADEVTTIHPRLAAELAAHSRSAPNVIYNWTHVPQPTGVGPNMRARLGWRDDEVIALHSGNMGSKQNLEVVVDAARLAAKEHRPVRFVLSGDGSRRADLERYAAGCPNLSFLNSVEDSEYMSLLSSADVLIVNERPGMREMSLPSKLTSYLVSGRPIVAATDLDSATAQFVRASGGGVVMTAGDHGQLLDLVEKIASDVELGDQLARNGREFADENLSEAGAFSAYDRWVTRLAGHRHG